MSAAFSLHRTDDTVRAYWVLACGERIGEVRRRAYGTGELHLRDGRYPLRRDDTADAVKKGAGELRATLREAAPRARYTLRDGAGDTILARAGELFHFSAKRSGLRVWPDDAGTEWTLTSPVVSSPRWSIAAGAGKQNMVGEVTSHRFAREVAWNGPSVSEPVAAFTPFVLHQQFGTHPPTGADAGGE